MSFQEKSAWVMAVCLLVSGLTYFGLIAAMSSAAGGLVPPLAPLVVVYTVVLVVLATVAHVVLALWSPREASAGLDERERIIATRASQRAGLVFACGVVLSLGGYLLAYDGNLLFYAVFASLMLGQIAEYGLQVVSYRTSV